MKSQLKYIFILSLSLKISIVSINAQLIVNYTGKDSLTCYNHSDGNLDLSVKGGTKPYNYLWEDGSRLNNRKNLKKGIYYCTITDNSIPTQSKVDSFKIYSPPDPIWYINPTYKRWECKSEMFLLLADSIKNIAFPVRSPYSFGNGDTTWNTATFSRKFPFDFWSVFNTKPYNFGVETLWKDSNGCIMPSYYPTDEIYRKYINIKYSVYPFEKDTLIQSGASVRLGVLLNSINYSDSILINWYENNQPISCSYCKSIRVSPKKNTVYRVEVSTKVVGCIKSHEFVVNVQEDSLKDYKEGKVYIPNIFSPDFNGYNDYFIPKFNESIERINKMIIYNRWGGIVYQKSDFYPFTENEGWDGRQHGKQSAEGVYLYYIEIQFKDQTIHKYKGDVYLMSKSD